MIKKILWCIFISLFCISTTIGAISILLCRHDNAKYQTPQSEIFVPEEIDTVLYHQDLHQLYVCYNAASCVNVYSSTGEFLWSVSTPYLRNSRFDLSKNELIIYGWEDAYIYNAEIGAFVAKKSVGELDLEYEWQHKPVKNPEPGEFYFDTYQIYRAEEDGRLTTLVARPLWYWIFNPACFASVAFCAAVGIGILLFLKVTQDYRLVQKKHVRDGEKVTARHPKARFIQKYFKVTSIVHLAYTGLNIIFGIFFEGILCIGIFPLALHFIISNGILCNRLNRINLTHDEDKIFNYWNAAELGSFIIAFFSVIFVAIL